MKPQKSMYLIFTLVVYAISACNNSKNKSCNIDSAAVCEKYNKTHPRNVQVANFGGQDNKFRQLSDPISQNVAWSYVYNYSQHPIVDLQTPTGKPLKSFFIDNAVISVIVQHAQVIKGINCYLAKRNDNDKKDDYTLVLIATKADESLIRGSDNKVAYAYDWHKPCPTCPEDNFGSTPTPP